MNTSVEFFEWLLHTGNEDNLGLLPNDEESPCRLGPPPSMVSFSDSELSSLESDDAETGSMCSNDCSTADKLGSSHHPKSLLLDSRHVPQRRVSFQHVEVREYSITVGDHPFCYDGLPLTLDWEHAGSVEIRDIASSRERRGNYRAPRRLSFDERRDRLFNMSGTSSSSSSSAESGGGEEDGENGENDRALELGLIIKMLHNSWSMNSILPPPVLYDIEEDEDDDIDIDEESVGSARSRRSRRGKKGNKSKNAQAEQVVEWKRVPFRRSNAFSE
jgi:hypothetical protein